MLGLAKDILTLLVLGVVCFGIGKKDTTWIWSIKKLKENWKKMWPLMASNYHSIVSFR